MSPTLLLLAATLGSSPELVENTSWEMVAPSLWDEPSRRAVEELAAKLPSAFRRPGFTVRFRVEDAQPFEPDAPHVLGITQNWGREVVLKTRGLAKQLPARLTAAWSSGDKAALIADFLIKRAIIHELTHVWDRGGRVSSTSQWRSIGGWSWLSLLPTARPHANDADFASPYGSSNAAEDLATFAEVYFLPASFGPTEADLHPKCRFAARYRFFAQRFRHPMPDASSVQCAAQAEVGLAPTQVRSVEVVWATPGFSSVASVGGHLLLMLEIENEAGLVRETFGLLADTTGVEPESPLYIGLGLAGGFRSRVVRDGYDAVALRYREDEGRNVHRFRWNLTEEQKARLLSRLDELTLHWSRPYFFFQRNCSELVVQLLQAVDPNPFTPPPVIPPDLVLAELLRRGWLTQRPTAPERDLEPRAQARLLEPVRTNAIAAVCGERFDQLNENDDETRDRGYAALLQRARSVNLAGCWREVAHVVLLSTPLERTRAKERKAQGLLPGYSAAVAAVRENISPAERGEQFETLENEMAEQYAARTITGPDTEHTPYIPLAVGASYDPASSPRPMLFIERAALQLRRTQPRVLAAARGLDVTALWFRSAFDLSDPRTRILLSFDALSLRYLGERVLPGLALGLHGRLLAGEHRFWDRTGDVRWVELGGALRVIETANGSVALDLTAAVSPRSFYGDEWRTRVEGPLRLHFAWHSPGALRCALLAQVGWLPYLTTHGTLSHAAEVAASSWIFLGRVSDAGVKLALSGRWRSEFAADARPELRADTGIAVDLF